MIGRTLKCLALVMGAMVLLGAGGTSLAVDATETGEDPTSDQSQVPTSPNVDINTIFGMQGLNTVMAPEKGGGGGGYTLLPLGSILELKSVGSYKNLNQNNPGWYWCGCRVNYPDSNFPVGAHAAIAFWDGASFTWSTNFGPDGVGPQGDLATNDSFEFYRFKVKEGVGTEAIRATLICLETNWKNFNKAGVLNWNGLPWTTPDMDGNCNTYCTYLLRGLGYEGAIPMWHHGGNVAFRSTYKDANKVTWQYLGLKDKEPFASTTWSIYQEPKP